MRFSFSLLFTFHILFLSAQKIMMLDPALKANSEAMPVKTKGIIGVGNMMKYEFGIYKVIKAKSGFGSITTRSKLLKALDESTSKSKMSFIMVANEKDTIITNVALNSKATTEYMRGLIFSNGKFSFGREEEGSLKELTKNFSAVISLPNDTTGWELVYFMQYKPDSSLRIKRNGQLVNGDTEIAIRSVTHWENGKSPALYPLLGFEFVSADEVIAAVQTPVDTFQKKFVWIKNNTDEKLKQVLAVAATALIAYSTSEFEAGY